MRGPILLLSILLLAAAAAAWFGLAPNDGSHGDRSETPAPPVELARHPSSSVPSDDGSTRHPAEPGTAAERTAVRTTRPGVSGRLVRAGVAIAGAELTAVANYGPTRTPVQGTSGVDGTFHLPVGGGQHRLQIRGSSVPRGFTWGPIAVAPGQHFQLGDVEVPLAATIAGRVVDDRGAPLAGARVFAAGDGEGDRTFRFDVVDPASPESAPNTATDADGRFAIAGLAPGKLKARAEHPGHQSWQGEATVAAGAVGDVGDLVLRRAETLRGFVFDATGAPVQGARVTPGGGRFGGLHPRQATTTRADGGFELPGFGKRGELSIEHAGAEPLVLELEDPRDAERIVLPPALPLAGTVLGNQGRPGRLFVSEAPDSRSEWPWWVQRVLYGEIPIAADGTFCVDALPRGPWVVRATIPGVGSVAPRTVALPLAAPLQLTVQPAVAVAVEVVDERGTPVPDAVLVRVRGDLPALPLADPGAQGRTWSAWGDRFEQTADAGGRATVQLPADEPLLLAVRGPLHGYSAIAAPAGEVPEQVRLTVTRGGGVHGSIANRDLLPHVRFVVQGALVSAPTNPTIGATVDRAGTFRSGPLPPGRYRLGLLLLDASSSGYDLPVPSPIPRLGNYDPVAPPVEVDVVAGGEHPVEFVVPACGEVTGRVLAGGQPVAGAIVFGKDPNRKAWDGLDEGGLDQHELQPHCCTDADGRFRFLVSAPGTYELRARHPRGAVWSEPRAVVCTAREGRVPCDLVLHAAVIRGSFDHRTLAPADREFFEAQLYPLAEAHHDPFFFADWSTSQAWRVQKVVVGKTGTFAFECLPPGGWVLRLVSRLARIELQRVLHTVADEVLELGPLELPKTVAARVTCGLQPGHGVWLLQPADGSEHGVFLRTLAPQEGRLELGEVAPGRYRLRAFVAGPMFLGNSGITGEATGEAIDLEVRADGSCEPARVWPAGIEAAATGR